MSFIFPRVAFTPVHCAPARREVVPLWSLFDETLNELSRASRPASRRQFNPRFDVKEAKDSFSLEGELPGIDQENISIEFTDEHTLTIKGHHEHRVQKGQRPQTVEGEKPTAAIQDATTTPETVKSHKATVEDEEPANASAVTQEPSQASPSSTTSAVASQEGNKTTEQQQPQESNQYWYSERSFGSFSRSFNFPSRVNQDAVKASLKNGILNIVVPKAAAPESRRIQIE